MEKLTPLSPRSDPRNTLNTPTRRYADTFPLVCFVALARSIFLVRGPLRTVGDGSRWATDFDQAIGEQRLAVFPDPWLIRVQDHGDHFMPFSEGGTNQDLLSGASVTGLESVTSGEMPKETVVVAQFVNHALR